jgi:hypothetical protein
VIRGWRIEEGQSICLVADKVKFAALMIVSKGNGLCPLLQRICDLEKHKFLHSCNKTRGQNHVLVMLLLTVCGNNLLLKLLVESICPGGAASQSGIYTLLGYNAALTGYSLLTFRDSISPFYKDQENH